MDKTAPVDRVTLHLKADRHVRDRLLGALRAKSITMQNFFEAPHADACRQPERIEDIQRWNAEVPRQRGKHQGDHPACPNAAPPPRRRERSGHMTPSTRDTVLFWIKVGLGLTGMLLMFGMLTCLIFFTVAQIRTLDENRARDRADAPAAPRGDAGPPCPHATPGTLTPSLSTIACSALGRQIPPPPRYTLPGPSAMPAAPD